MANESTIHTRNLKFFLSQIYKFLNDLFPPTMNEVFQTNNCPYDLRNPRIVASKHKSSIKYGINSIAKSSNLAKHSLRKKKLGIT